MRVGSTWIAMRKSQLPGWFCRGTLRLQYLSELSEVAIYGVLTTFLGSNSRFRLPGVGFT
jgi:hypothetical protein